MTSQVMEAAVACLRSCVDISHNMQLVTDAAKRMYEGLRDEIEGCVQGCGKGVARVWQGCGKGVARMWQGCGKGVARVWLGCG